MKKFIFILIFSFYLSSISYADEVQIIRDESSIVYNIDEFKIIDFRKKPIILESSNYNLTFLDNEMYTFPKESIEYIQESEDLTNSKLKILKGNIDNDIIYGDRITIEVEKDNSIIKYDTIDGIFIKYNGTNYKVTKENVFDMSNINSNKESDLNISKNYDNSIVTYKYEDDLWEKYKEKENTIILKNDETIKHKNSEVINNNAINSTENIKEENNKNSIDIKKDVEKITFNSIVPNDFNNIINIKLKNRKDNSIETITLVKENKYTMIHELKKDEYEVISVYLSKENDKFDINFNSLILMNNDNLKKEFTITINEKKVDELLKNSLISKQENNDNEIYAEQNAIDNKNHKNDKKNNKNWLGMLFFTTLVILIILLIKNKNKIIYKQN